MLPLTLGQQAAQFQGNATAPDAGTQLLAQMLQGGNTGLPSAPGNPGPQGGLFPNRGPSLTPTQPSFAPVGSPGSGVGYTPPAPPAPAPAPVPAPAKALLPWERPEWVPKGGQ